MKYCCNDSSPRTGAPSIARPEVTHPAPAERCSALRSDGSGVQGAKCHLGAYSPRAEVVLRWLLLVLVTLSSPVRASVVINEFLANNGGGLQDGDLESPDWIELHNSGPGVVNLGGWHLTDSASDPTRWTFPSTNLPSGGYLIVFASGKNRAVAGRELHTNFQLNNDEEYLALIEPDGTTIADAFAPAYPNQRANVSYGRFDVESAATPLVTGSAGARVHVPTDGSLGTAWTATGFDDSTWLQTNVPIGFESGFNVTSLLAMDVNERGQNPLTTTQPGFSAFVTSAGGNSTTTVPTTQTYGAISVTVSNTAGFGYDDRLRNDPANSGAFTESFLLRDFLFSRDNTGTGGLDIDISGLTSSLTYRVTVWSFDDSSFGAKVSDWYANGLLVKTNYTFDGAVSPTSNDQYQFTFDTTANGSGQILIAGRRDLTSSSYGAYLNALKVETLSPIPITNGLGALMLSNNASAYIRIPFSVTDPGAFNTLRMRIQYNDGFTAYVNGQAVASRNAPGSPQWNSSATAGRSPAESMVFEEIAFPNPAGLLQAGVNALAIHGLNVDADDGTFLIHPELEGLNSSSELRYFSPPTPGAANDPGYVGLVADTKFSVDRGFYDTPFTVAITSATATASIYWTTNGSIPSPANGTLYTGPVSVTGITSLRASAFLNDYVPSVPDAQTYLFLDQVLQQPDNPPGYPTSWQGTYPADYGMDPAIVNSPNYGPTLEDDLRAIPTLSVVSTHDAFWDVNTGIYYEARNEWAGVTDRGERQASAELFEGDNTSEFQINCAVQMHGQAGRDNERSMKHSFRLEFKNDYGPSRLHYDWFGGGVTDFDSIILRNSWADTWTTRYDPYTQSPPYTNGAPIRYRPETATYLRDIWVKQAMRDMGYAASRSRYVHLYLNGLYWGIYATIERHDPAYFANHFGGYEKDWDILKDNSELQNGSRTDWDDLIALVNLGINSESAFQAVAAQVDMDNLIDYMLLHATVEANDWLQDSNPHNWYGAHRRANSTNGLPATKWIFLPWDQEIAFNRFRNDDRVNVSADGRPSRIYSQLRNWPEFRRMYGDRVQKHLFNGGALSPSNNVARLQSLAAEIDRAIVGESARWGDTREFPIGNDPGTGLTLTRDEYWIPELQALMTNWFPNVMHQRTIDRLRAANLYPAVGAPEFSQFGGAVSNGFTLTISQTNIPGQIYFTLDGSDPRQYGSGAVAAGAQGYSGPIPINAPTWVRARAWQSGNWSALVEAVFYPPQDLSGLALTEIMYHPPDMGQIDGNDLEFLELKNTGTNTLNLSGLTFTSGITFTFTNGTVLGPGQFFVLARDAVAFATKYPGVTVHGTYTGQLDNGGERLALSHALGTPIFSVTYNDRPPWPVGPDVADFSLVQTAPGVSQAPDKGNRWRASTNPGGSPGADDPAPTIAPIVISEILTHTDLPLKDSIELYNPTAGSVNIGGWFLTDEADTPVKFRIPDNTFIPAGGRIFFDEDDFNATPGSANSFLLSSTGDDVHLFSATTNGTLAGYSHSAEFGASFNGVSFGRYVNSAGDESYPPQTALTLGSVNPGPIIGPVVISEIQYHPDINDDEFVELLNITGSAVPLFSVAFPTNAWKLGGVNFTIPTNVTLGANATLLVVATNPATFRSKYSVPTNIPIFGPYAGQLQDSGENLELKAPDNPNTNGVPYVTVDAVRYNDRDPWPPAADGSGMSLQRAPAGGYGNEPTNWIAAAPTPGQVVNTGDSDGDGLPDWWEQAHGTYVFIADANEDPDNDGLTNREEYLAGTHPNDPSSALAFQGIVAGGGNVILRFVAVSNRTYTVFRKPALSDPTWQKLVDVSSTTSSAVVSITNALSGSGAEFYWLVTPMQP